MCKYIKVSIPGFGTAKEFIITNNHKLGTRDELRFARTLQVIRENYYSDEEIKD